MEANRKRLIDLALRKNRGRQLFAEWSHRLSRACGVEVPSSSFLTVERAEVLKKLFFERVKEGSGTLGMDWDNHSIEQLLAHLHDMCLDVRSLPVILFSSADKYIGAVRLPADCILRNAMIVWKVVEEDLALCSEDLQHGLCLEENYFTPSGDYVREGIYELTVWGIFARRREMWENRDIQD